MSRRERTGRGRRRLGYESLEGRRLLAAQIFAGHHVLAPDEPGQRVPIAVGGEAAITGVNLRVQLGDGFGPAGEPRIAGVDITDSIWRPLTPTILGGPVVEGSSLLQVSIVLDQSGLFVSPPGVLGQILIDTSGIFAGQFDLKLADTEIGADTDLVGDVAEVVNGSISIAMPGDANLDGVFNSADFVHVFQAGEYEDGVSQNSTWADGDWNGDGDFSSSDLVYALQSGGYRASARPARNLPPHENLFAAWAATCDDDPDWPINRGTY